MKGRTSEYKNTETHCKRRKPWKRHQVTDTHARTASGLCLLCGIRQPISDHRSYRNHSKISEGDLLQAIAALSSSLICSSCSIKFKQQLVDTGDASTHRGNQLLITDPLWALEVIKMVPGTWRELPCVTLSQVHQPRNNILANGYGYSNIGHRYADPKNGEHRRSLPDPLHTRRSSVTHFFARGCQRQPIPGAV